jgi:hypothetical protein
VMLRGGDLKPSREEEELSDRLFQVEGMGRIAFRARALRAPPRVADHAKWALARFIRSAINPVAMARPAHRGNTRKRRRVCVVWASRGSRRHSQPDRVGGRFHLQAKLRPPIGPKVFRCRGVDTERNGGVCAALSCRLQLQNLRDSSSRHFLATSSVPSQRHFLGDPSAPSLARLVLRVV